MLSGAKDTCGKPYIVTPGLLIDVQQSLYRRTCATLQIQHILHVYFWLNCFSSFMPCLQVSCINWLSKPLRVSKCFELTVRFVLLHKDDCCKNCIAGQWSCVLMDILHAKCNWLQAYVCESSIFSLRLMWERQCGGFSRAAAENFGNPQLNVIRRTLQLLMLYISRANTLRDFIPCVSLYIIHLRLFAVCLNEKLAARSVWIQLFAVLWGSG